MGEGTVRPSSRLSRLWAGFTSIHSATNTRCGRVGVVG
jgi:hypothetical protein